MNTKITSLQNPLVKHLIKVRQNTDYRYDHESVVIEGVKTVSEVGLSHPIKTIVVCDPSFIPPTIKADHVYIVTEGVMNKISGMKTPEGIIAEVSMPKPVSLKGKRRILVLDNVSDPGNVGTILRTALAFKWGGVFIISESCDPFNEKALRASRGAAFRIPLSFGSWEDVKKLVANDNLHPLVADLDGKDFTAIKPQNGVLLVLGNEASGPSDEAKKLCEKISIPMPGKMESLNVSVAGGILMYALREPFVI